MVHCGHLLSFRERVELGVLKVKQSGPEIQSSKARAVFRKRGGGKRDPDCRRPVMDSLCVCFVLLLVAFLVPHLPRPRLELSVRIFLRGRRWHQVFGKASQGWLWKFNFKHLYPAFLVFKSHQKQVT